MIGEGDVFDRNIGFLKVKQEAEMRPGWLSWIPGKHTGGQGLIENKDSSFKVQESDKERKRLAAKL